MIRDADLIVRATAQLYLEEPTTNEYGMVTARIGFRVDEVLKGKSTEVVLAIEGLLTQEDDFNDHDPPYTFVRPEGRSGSCFATTYREQGQFLLMLKRKEEGYTPYWDPLAPIGIPWPRSMSKCGRQMIRGSCMYVRR